MKTDIFELCFLFLLGSIFGVFWEDTIYLFTHHFKLINHYGVIYGPFNPLYGFACVISTIILANKKHSILTSFIIAFFLGGLIEYSAGLLLSITLNVRCWNYNSYFLNISGYTTVPYMICWAIIIIIFIKFIYPRVSLALKILSKQLKIFFSWLIILFFVFDITLSTIALTRQKERHQNIPVTTKIDEYCDKYYSDDFLKTRYTNMEFLIDTIIT